MANTPKRLSVKQAREHARAVTVELTSMLRAMRVTPEQFEACAVAAVSRQPKLLECTAASLQLALASCAEMQLLPNGKDAVIVPYWNRNIGQSEAVAQPMVKGKIKLAMRASPGLVISAHPVYGGEAFQHTAGLHPDIVHETDGGVDRTLENLYAAYAVAWLPGASVPVVEVIYRREIDWFKAKAQNLGKGIWEGGGHDEMAEKCVIGRLLKRLPEGYTPAAFESQPYDMPDDAVDVDSVDDGDGDAAIPSGEVVSAPAVDDGDGDAPAVDDDGDAPALDDSAAIVDALDDDYPAAETVSTVKRAPAVRRPSGRSATVRPGAAGEEYRP